MSFIAPPDLLAGEQLPPEPKQARSRQKREALLAAGLALFGERGYEGAAVEEIAQRAGVAVGAFYQHFASKRQLVLVLMSRLLHEAAGLVGQTQGADATDPGAVLGALVRQALALDWAYAGAYRAWREVSAQDPALAELNARAVAWTTGQLAVLLGALAALPGARPDLDVPVLAGLINTLFWRLAEEPLHDPVAITRLTDALTAMLTHAIFADAQGATPGRPAPPPPAGA